MIKRLLLIPLLALMLYLFIGAMEDLTLIYDNAGKVFFRDNAYFDTGSKNFVSAIYLDYRLFDSIFEAGILLIAVSGVMFVSQHTIQEKNANFMLDKYKTPDLFVTFSRLLYPIMLAFGLYVIIAGQIGGGFQGGAIVATAILILYYIDIHKTIGVRTVLVIVKVLFMLLIIVSFISLFTRDAVFTNFITSEDLRLKAVYLKLMNVLIGAIIAYGLVGVFTAFLKEGR